MLKKDLTQAEIGLTQPEKLEREWLFVHCKKLPKKTLGILDVQGRNGDFSKFSFSNWTCSVHRATRRLGASCGTCWRAIP